MIKINLTKKDINRLKKLITIPEYNIEDHITNVILYLPDWDKFECVVKACTEEIYKLSVLLNTLTKALSDTQEYHDDDMV